MNLFEEFDIEYEDITDKLGQLAEFQCEQDQSMLSAKNYKLKDSLADIEACDPRTDIKCNMEQTYQANKKIQENELKPACELTDSEMIGIYDAFLQRELAWITGQSLPHCFYEFVYIHFEDTYKDSCPLIDQLIKHQQCAMRDFYCMIQSTDYRTYDDFHVSILGFFKINEDPDILSSQMKTLENKYQGKLTKVNKKQYDKAEFKIEDALVARLCLRKAITSLIRCLQKTISSQKKQNIEQVLNSCEKNIEICKRTLRFSTDVSQYFNPNCLQSVLCQFSVRAINYDSVEKTFDNFMEMISHLRIILDMPEHNSILQMYQEHQKFGALPTNVLVRTVLNMNVLDNENYYFGKRSLLEFVHQGIGYENLKGFLKFPEEKKAFEENTVSIIQSMLLKIMRSSYSFHAKLNKRAFLELSYLLHEGAKCDDLLELKYKPFMLYFYNLVMFFNVKKLELTFNLECYSNFELPWVWLYLDECYSVVESNLKQQIFYHRFEPEINKANAHNMKIHFDNKNQDVKHTWTNYCIFRIKKKMADAMLTLSQIFLKIGLINRIGDDAEVARRFKQRFRPFKPCIYSRKFTYDDYVKLENIAMKTDLKDLLLPCKQKFLMGKSIADDVINSEVYLPEFDKELKDLRKTLIANSLLTIFLMKDCSKMKFEVKNCVDNLPIYQLKS